MTVIAWDGKTLAADKRGCQSGFVYSVTKIFRVKNRLVGFSGDAGRIGEFLAWLKAGAHPKTYPKNDYDSKDESYVWMLVIRADGTIEKYETSGYPIIVEEPFFATGGGRDYAIAAMHLGFDARRAVEVACRFDEGSGNGIDILTFKSP
jgi:hypothetical protein